MSRLSIRDLRDTVKYAKDIQEVEKLLEIEKSFDNPRKTALDILNKKIESYTITAETINEEQIAVVQYKDGVPVGVVEAKTEILSDPTLLVLVPEEKEFKKFDPDEYGIEGLKDKVGYQKVKDGLKALSTLRRMVDTKRKQVNEPLRTRVSENNELATNLINKIKDYEANLKSKKENYEALVLEAKQQRLKEKEAKRLAEEQAQREEEKRTANAKKQALASADFKSKYGNIIKRAEQRKAELRENVNEIEVQTEEVSAPEPIKETQVLLSDHGIIEWKIKMLERIKNFDQVPSNNSLKQGSVIIDNNIQKLIDYAKSLL